MNSNGHSSLVLFVAYTAVVLLLAWLSHRTLRKRSFVSEYFLGSRSLGMLALALTFGATSASAGSFAGFPSLVYSHGWVLALWIASYMIFPLCGMGLLGKRLNIVARRTGAITVPDILRERFDSPGLALVGTLLLALMLTVYLIPQFTLAALIMQQLLGDTAVFQRAAFVLAQTAPGVIPVGVGSDYVLGLLLFALLVIVYTTFGGFRAVVWTDILQGFVMLVGVVLMLTLALVQTGGLKRMTMALAEMTPPLLGEAVIRSENPAPNDGYFVPADRWISLPGGRILRTNQAAILLPGETASGIIKVVEITTPREKAVIIPAPLPSGLILEVQHMHAYASGAGRPGTYTHAPGPSARDAGGFLPLGLAVSFFAFWALSGTGQPGNMVRLMAFSHTRTLRRAIASLSVYFALIYFPLVIIFCSARVLAPGLDQTPDRIMPVMAFLLADGAHVPWLAGLLIAVPFAAAMSTVDSFILMITSSIVRDVYQRNLRPNAREIVLRRLSYVCTTVVGIVAMVGALYPPQFLQYIIVFTGGGLAVAFLGPVALGLYWPRFNAAGAFACMVGGFIAYLGLYVAGFVAFGGATPIRPLGLDPLIWGFACSLLCAVAGTYTAPPSPERILRTHFHT